MKCLPYVLALAAIAAPIAAEEVQQYRPHSAEEIKAAVEMLGKRRANIVKIQREADRAGNNDNFASMEELDSYLKKNPDKRKEYFGSVSEYFSERPGNQTKQSDNKTKKFYEARFENGLPIRTTTLEKTEAETEKYRRLAVNIEKTGQFTEDSQNKSIDKPHIKTTSVDIPNRKKIEASFGNSDESNHDEHFIPCDVLRLRMTDTQTGTITTFYDENLDGVVDLGTIVINRKVTSLVELIKKNKNYQEKFNRSYDALVDIVLKTIQNEK